MSIILQPFLVDPHPNRVDRYELEEVSVAIELRWSERLQRWYATAYDEDAEVIFANRGINPEYAIFIRNLSEKLPPGILSAVATDDAFDAITFEQLGRRIVILYFETDEIPAPRAPTDAVTAEVVE